MSYKGKFCVPDRRTVFHGATDRLSPACFSFLDTITGSSKFHCKSVLKTDIDKNCPFTSLGFHFFIFSPKFFQGILQFLCLKVYGLINFFLFVNKEN